MKFMVVVVGAGALAFLGAVICIVASVYPRKQAAPDGDNSTSTESLLPLEPETVAQAGPLGALHGGASYDSGNALSAGPEPSLSFSRLVCTPLPLRDCHGRVQADEPQVGADEDWSSLRATADELQQVIRQQNQQILMDQRTIRELTGKLSECESGLEELPAPEQSIDLWSGNRRIMAGDEVGSTAAQMQTARAVEELARAIMDLKDRIEKLEVGPPARAKAPWRVEDLEGELERKIKMLEKERQAMRKDNQGTVEKGSPGGESQLQHCESTRHIHKYSQSVARGLSCGQYMYGLVRREVTEMYAFNPSVTPFSLLSPRQPNDMVLLQGRTTLVELLINDKVAQLPLDLLQGQWQHVCVSWTLRDGVWKAYQAGRLKGRGEGLAAWHPIKPGGVLILGQEQDTVGGRFDASQALVGELSQFNLWDRVLKPAEVSALADCSSSALGNIAPWTDLDVDVYGGATKESTEPCHGTHKAPSPNQ
uniref:Neuronal pentraxin receptor b n=1 Tax=Neogobius melanostomus TaxID=47308 RepID=A0A8C6WLX2_9GOBI